MRVPCSRRLMLALMLACMLARAHASLSLRGRSARRRKSLGERPIIVSMGSATVPDSEARTRDKGSAHSLVHRHRAFTTKPPFHQSAYHSVPSGNLDATELSRRAKMLTMARQREIQSEMNATMQQMRLPMEDSAAKQRAFEDAETLQQLQTHHLPGMTKQPAKAQFDPRKDPLWNVVMRKRSTGSAYKAKRRTNP